MKLKELTEKAESEITEEIEQKALEVVKRSIKDIRAAKRTLKALEKQHEKLLETDLEDIEEDDYEY